eukprot:1299975-Pyramimonas_sp.AAC.1
MVLAVMLPPLVLRGRLLQVVEPVHRGRARPHVAVLLADVGQYVVAKRPHIRMREPKFAVGARWMV